MEKKISVVMTYHNRVEQLVNTLNSINSSAYKNYELIIVDDGSDDNNRAEDVLTKVSLPDISIQIIYLDPEKKWWTNPCIPFNMGFRKATGDIVLIQNPECYHVGNILNYVNENLKENDYFSFGCYSLSKELSVLKPHILEDRCATFDGDSGWYNHPRFRPAGYHFCSAIYKFQLDELNGFDERYAKGVGWDDNEFLVRIMRKGLLGTIIGYPFVVHQWHYTSNVWKAPSQDNAALFNQVTLKETTWRTNENNRL